MRVLSYGCGVNSTAILALIKLGKIKIPDRIIFCDTGAERPETSCYLEYIKKEFPIIKTVHSLCAESLLAYCKKYKIIPARMTRWCTIDFKIKPFEKEMKDIKHTKILGIGADERQRVRDLSCEYPLIDLAMSRNDCRKIIEKVKWEVPVKSGCYICPFMKIKELVELKDKHRDLFDILVELEKIAHNRNPKIYFKKDKLIPEYIGNDIQEELDGFENYQHCLCKFD